MTKSRCTKHSKFTAVAGEGQAHIALWFGRVLLYLEERAALETLVDAVEAAYELREEVFGSGHDLTEVAQVGRASFEARPQASGSGPCVGTAGTA
jgi:hypothetical protein